MDPGVACPNAVLEQIASGHPKSIAELGKLGALRGWRLDAFGEEVLNALGIAASGAASEAKRAPAGRPAAKLRSGRPPDRKPPLKQK